MADEKRVKIGNQELDRVVDNFKASRNSTGKSRPLSWEEIRQQKMEKAMMKAMEADENNDWESFMSFYRQMMQIKMMPQIFSDMTNGFNGMSNNNNTENSRVAELEARLTKMDQEHKEEREQWKRDKEKEETDRKFQALEYKLDKLTDALANSRNKNESDPILEELKATRTEIATMKKKEVDEHNEHRFDSIENAILDLRDAQQNVRQTKGDDIDSFLENARKMENKKKELAKYLGLAPDKAEGMSATDMINFATEKVPEIGKAVRTVRDLFNPQEIEDDLPPEETVPVREITTNSSMIEPAMAEFISSMKTRPDGAIVDPKGGTWNNPDGSLMTKQQLELYSKANPGLVRQMIADYQDAPVIQQPKQESPKKEPVPQNRIRDKPTEPVKSDVQEEQAPVEYPEPEQQNNIDVDSEVEKYLNSLKDLTDEEGNTMAADPDGVVFVGDDGHRLTKEELQKEAEKSGNERFWNDVQEVRKSVLSMKDDNGDDNDGKAE